MKVLKYGGEGKRSTDLSSSVVRQTLVGTVLDAGFLGGPVLSPWLRRRQIYRQLHPLWRALATAFPDICLDGRAYRASGTHLPLRNSRAAIYRTVIEIHDGLRRLRAFVAYETTPHCAAGLDDRQAAAITVASYVRAALIARHTGTLAPGDAPAPPPPYLLAYSDQDPDREAQWLADIATVFRNPGVGTTTMSACHRRDEANGAGVSKYPPEHRLSSPCTLF